MDRALAILTCIGTHEEVGRWNPDETRFDSQQRFGLRRSLHQVAACCPQR